MSESEHVRLARATIEAYVRDGTVLEVQDAPESLRMQRAGAFVSIKARGALRGCIGTIEPCAPTLAEEIIRNAIQAATCDPRFPPIGPEELDDLNVSVDVLHPAEDAVGEQDLDPEKYGVIVSCDFRRGLLLPAIEGVETARDQVEIACQKAGISPAESYNLRRFKVDRFT